MQQRVIGVVEELVREAALLVRDAERRREDAERLLRQLRAGTPVTDVSYFPDLQPLGGRLAEASVRADTVMRLAIEQPT
jgi:hypothetical protein